MKNMRREYKGYLIAEDFISIQADQGVINERRWNVLEKGAADVEWKKIVRKGFESEADAEKFIDELLK
jgi:hypothetical protein